jgi:hypothetical protein
MFRELAEHALRNSTAYYPACQGVYRETISRRKTYRPENTRRIVAKTLFMKNAHDFIAYIRFPSKKIDERAKTIPGDTDRKCINGKIPSRKVFFDGRETHRRQRSGR